MSLDYKKAIYRPERVDVEGKTSYGMMSTWMHNVAKDHQARPALPAGLIASQNRSPAFARKTYRPRQRDADRGPVWDDPRDRASGPAQQAAIDEALPMHLRYSHNNGHDDFHRAFHAISRHWPSLSFPAFGPPRLRHGRLGGSWRHVREVLQAHGNRICYVDGNVTINDTMALDEVPGGHLIKQKAEEGDRPEPLDTREYRIPRHQYEAMFVKKTPRDKPSKQLMIHRLQAQDPTSYGLDTRMAMENTNWKIMR